MLPGELAECVKIRIPFTGGVDESSAVDDVAIEDAIEMENFRLSKDGKRIEKRLGTSTGAEFGAGINNLFSYHSYRDSNGDYCKLATLEATLRRQIESASWTIVHTWASTIAHPVRPLEIQGKQFVITEQDSRMIHTDGNDYQIGIDAPTTIPTITSGYDAAIIEEDCAAIGDWGDNDAGAGASTQVTYDSKSCFRFLNTGSAGDEASRTRYASPAKLPAKFAVETSLYINTLGSAIAEDGLFIAHFTGTCTCGIGFDDDELWIVNGAGYPDDCIPTGISYSQDTWIDVKYVFDGSDPDNMFIDVWIDDDYKGRWTIDNTVTSLPGYNIIIAYGETLATDVYMDYINISDAGSARLLGKYRYAVTYARSGNFGNESNPIKSLVGSESFTGSGLDDLTSGGTYTGDIDRNVRIRIDGTGTPNTIEVSYDKGNTWHSTDQNITTTMYLNYGITLTWGATTGHTSGDYWDFTCSAIDINATNQKVTLSSIPISSDSQVDQRKIYRTTSGGATFYWLATINDNTTTTFVDNIPDSGLGLELEEDHDVLPNGKFAVWWDERLWVSGDNIIYYSAIDNPEAFDTDIRYITIRKGDKSNEITQMIDYKDALYVFKKNSVFIILKKPDGRYGRYLLTRDFGCIAPWSMIEVNNFLMFLSYRGIELFNGVDSYTPNFSVAVQRTIAAIDNDYLDYICSAHCRARNEVWFSIPYDTDGTTKKTIVYNYIASKFYIFNWAFSYTVTSLSETLDSAYTPKVYIGTTSGRIMLADTGYQDSGVNITATVRKKWFDTQVVGTLRRFDIKYEIPSGMTLTGNFYKDFDKDVARTTSHTGVALSSTDIELRRVIKDYAEFGLEGRWFCFELVNAENLGGHLKINEAVLYLKPRTIKGKKYGD